jgi:hypothetical protein
MARLRLKNGMAKVVSYEIPIFHLNKQEHIISTIALTLSRHLNGLIELFGSAFFFVFKHFIAVVSEYQLNNRVIYHLFHKVYVRNPRYDLVSTR